VITASAPELSWLFTQLRDIFAGCLDGQTKIEFFGRLANSALRYQARKQGEEALQDLLGAVLHEAFAIAEEMEDGVFHSLSVASGNEIVDDYIDEAERTGFIGVEETKRFFAEKGIQL
jgi:phosphoribosyl-ATP pyrophosphohydrolase